jgi:hypothetical protein
MEGCVGLEVGGGCESSCTGPMERNKRRLEERRGVSLQGFEPRKSQRGKGEGVRSTD